MNKLLAQIRADEIELIRQHVLKNDSVLVYGVPGVGISSLFRLTEELLDEKECQVVNLDLNVFSSYTLAGFVDMLFSSVQRNFELSGLAFKYNSLDEFLFSKNQPIKKLVIQIDRFEKALQFMQSDFYDFLRAIRDNSPIQIVYVIGIDRDLSFYRNFWSMDEFYSLLRKEVFVRPLNNAGATLYTQNKLVETKVEPNTKLIEDILHLTSGHIRFINLLTSSLQENEDINIVRSQNEHKFDYLSKRILDSLLPLEQQTLKDIILSEQNLNAQSVNTLLKIGILNESKQIFSQILIDFLKKQVLTPNTLFYYDETSNRFYKNNVRIDTKLTYNEFKALQILNENSGSVIDRNELAENVWGAKMDQGVSDEAIDQLIKRLREKIEDDPSNPKFIQTVRGRGFIFETNK